MKKIFLFSFLFTTYISFGQKQIELFFDYNQDYPNEKSIEKLNTFLDSNSQIIITAVSGYCDSIDTNDYNKKLAERRINSVLELLRKNDIPLKPNLVIDVVGEDFKQSEKQSENRKVIFEYMEIYEAVSSNDNSVETKPIPVEEKVMNEKVEKERSLLKNKFKKTKVGDRIAIYNIHFIFNSENVIIESKPILEELLSILENNPKMVIKIHGHICCNPNPYFTKLSYRRALKIFNYLKDNGIEQNRLAYNGVGSNNPIYPIPEKTEEERIANRRVEIEIIRK